MLAAKGRPGWSMVLPTARTLRPSTAGRARRPEPPPTLHGIFTSHQPAAVAAAAAAASSAAEAELDNIFAAPATARGGGTPPHRSAGIVAGSGGDGCGMAGPGEERRTPTASPTASMEGPDLEAFLCPANLARPSARRASRPRPPVDAVAVETHLSSDPPSPYASTSCGRSPSSCSDLSDEDDGLSLWPWPAPATHAAPLGGAAAHSDALPAAAPPQHLLLPPPGRSDEFEEWCPWIPGELDRTLYTVFEDVRS